MTYTHGTHSQCLGGGNSNIFEIFTPKIGEDFQFDVHIFQTGGKKPPTRCVLRYPPSHHHSRHRSLLPQEWMQGF